jgi:hypothetical protein
VDSRPRGAAILDVEKGGENVDVLPPWWWNPSNPQATSLPAGVSISKYSRVLKGLQSIDPKIGLTWHGARHVWQLWYDKPGFSTYGNGWVMVKEFEPYRNTDYILKVVEHMNSDVVGTASQRHAKAVEARKANVLKIRKELFQRDLDIAGDVYDFRSIRNIGKGSNGTNFG